jgi:drug/metabolite transporter (DMT)-like permease
MGILSTVGQMFVYRMIKQFKQHFVPFVITTRKIFTVGLSIFFYHHETNILQISGLVMVFVIVTYEFVSELMGEKNDAHHEHHGSANEIASKSSELTVAEV